MDENDVIWVKIAGKTLLRYFERGNFPEQFYQAILEYWVL